MPESKEGEVGVRIPLSLGDKAEDFDKAGNPCIVFDVIWNPEVTEHAKKEMLYR